MHDNTPQADPPGTWTADGQSKGTPGQTRARYVAVGLLALAGLWTLRGFLPALSWAAILAASLWPWRVKACRAWPKGASLVWPLVFTLGVALLFVVPLAMVARAVADDSRMLAQWLATVRAQGVSVPAFVAHLPMSADITRWWQANLATPEAINHLQLGAGGAASFGQGEHLLGLVAGRVLLIGFMLLILFFLLRDGDKVSQGLRIGCRRGFGEAGLDVADQALRAVRGTVNGLVVVGFGEGLLLGVVYGVAGVSHAALLGVLTGLLSAVPLGASAAVAVAVATLAAGGQMAAAITVGVIGVVVVFAADHFVRPVMIGDATRLPFLWVLLGILGGVEVWGLIGLVMGPALMAVLMLLWREWVGSQAGPLNPPG